MDSVVLLDTVTLSSIPKIFTQFFFDIAAINWPPRLEESAQKLDNVDWTYQHKNSIIKDGPFLVSFSFIFVFSKYSTNLAGSENRTRIGRVEILNADH